MKISTAILLLVIGWFVAGLPIGIVVAIYCGKELRAEHSDKEYTLYTIMMFLGIMMSSLVLFSLI